MEKIDAGEELFGEIELIGRTGLFTELREDKRTIPDCFRGGKELAEFLEPTFPITETEGDKLLGLILSILVDTFLQGYQCLSYCI